MGCIRCKAAGNHDKLAACRLTSKIKNVQVVLLATTSLCATIPAASNINTRVVLVSCFLLVEVAVCLPCVFSDANKPACVLFGQLCTTANSRAASSTSYKEQGVVQPVLFVGWSIESGPTKLSTIASLPAFCIVLACENNDTRQVSSGDVVADTVIT